MDVVEEKKQTDRTANAEPVATEIGAAKDVAAKNGAVVLFDGVCNFCNGAVQFIVDHEKTADLAFAPIQSDLAATLLEKTFGKERAKALREGMTGSGDPDTIVLVEDSKGFTHSSAGLRIARHLRAPWSWVFAFVIVPRPIRDLVYRFIARNRYRWFGKTETCRVPTPALRKRFLA